MWSRRLLYLSGTRSRVPILSHALPQKNEGFTRTLFAGSKMGMDGFTKERVAVKLQFSKIDDKFRVRMNEVLESERNNTIYTEDLKNAVYLFEDNEEDLDLLVKMVKKFNQQNDGLRFGAYVFGPVVLRLLYLHNKPTLAYELLNLEELDGFFDQMITYQLAIDMLYNNEMYTEAMEVFDKVQNKRIGGHKYPRSCLTLALASLYKMNTPEALDKAIAFMEDADEKGFIMNSRQIAFIAALALRQQYPHITLKLLEKAQNARMKHFLNLKVLASSEMGKVEELLPVLRGLVQIDIPDISHNNRKPSLLQQSVEAVNEALAQIDDKILKNEFMRVFKSLEENNLILKSMELSDLITAEIVDRPNEGNRGRQDKAMMRASFNRGQPPIPPRQHNQWRRQGLFEQD